jgi:hypothetical protein
LVFSDLATFPLSVAAKPWIASRRYLFASFFEGRVTPAVVDGKAIDALVEMPITWKITH